MSPSERRERGKLGRCWDIADRNIERYRRSIERAQLGGTANIAICREKIDQWLEYRHKHGPDDETVL